jgi:hypothetical protein
LPLEPWNAAGAAARFESSTAQVNDMLCRLMEDGMVRVDSPSMGLHMIFLQTLRRHAA